MDLPALHGSNPVYLQQRLTPTFTTNKMQRGHVNSADQPKSDERTGPPKVQNITAKHDIGFCKHVR